MHYFLLDLERTIANGIPAYWKGNKRGYTYNVEFAGIFSKEAAEAIVNSDFDKTTIMISLQQIEKILGKDMKAHEGY